MIQTRVKAAKIVTVGSEWEKEKKKRCLFLEVGRTDAIAALVRRGAELDKELDGGVTPLVYAARVQEVDSITAGPAVCPVTTQHARLSKFRSTL